MDSIKKIKQLLNAGLISAFFVGFLGLLQIFGKFILPSEITKTKMFNMVGTFNGLGIFCAFILVITIAYLISLYASKDSKPKENLATIILTVFLWSLSALMFLNVILLDYWVIWLGVIVAMIMILAFSFSKASNLNTKWLMLPMIILVISVLFQFINLPINLGLPAEVSPSYKASWQITKGALQDKPLLGSGQGTFIYDYAKFKPESINNTQFWNLRFDRSISHAMTILATTGILGTVTWLIFFGAFIYFVISRFIKARSDGNWLLGIGLFAAWFVLFISKFVYASNITLEFLTWFMLALVAIFALSDVDVKSVSFESSPKTGLLLSFVFILVVTFSASGLYLVGQRYAAEVYYKKALVASTQPDNFLQVNNYIGKAATLNVYMDTYFRTLGILYINEIEKKAKEFSVSDDEKKALITRDIQLLTDGAINTAKKATELSENNVSNWSVLGEIYQKISGYVSGSEVWALESFDKATELEPSSPVHYTNSAKSYLYIYDLNKQMAQVEGVDKTALEAEAQENLEKAEEKLNKAIELKPNYAQAHYQMALVHVRKGDLEKAINELVVNYNINPNDVGILFQLGLLYYQNDQKDLSQAAFEKAVSLSPNYSNARWFLAAIYEENGNTAGAIEQIEKVKELNPENELVIEKLRALKGGTSKPAPPLPEPVETRTETVTTPEVDVAPEE